MLPTPTSLGGLGEPQQLRTRDCHFRRRRTGRTSNLHAKIDYVCRQVNTLNMRGIVGSASWKVKRGQSQPFVLDSRTKSRPAAGWEEVLRGDSVKVTHVGGV